MCKDSELFFCVLQLWLSLFTSECSYLKTHEVKVTAIVWMTQKGGDAINLLMSIPCITQKHYLHGIWLPDNNHVVHFKKYTIHMLCIKTAETNAFPLSKKQQNEYLFAPPIPVDWVKLSGKWISQCEGNCRKTLKIIKERRKNEQTSLNRNIKKRNIPYLDDIYTMRLRKHFKSH